MDYPEVFGGNGRPIRERWGLDYGDWGPVILELSNYDVDVARRVARWPIRDGLYSYIQRAKHQAAESYWQAMVVWALQAPHCKKTPNPPDLPRILKED